MKEHYNFDLKIMKFRRETRCAYIIILIRIRVWRVEYIIVVVAIGLGGLAINRSLGEW